MAKSTQLELIRNLAQSREQELAEEVGELQRLKTNAEQDLNRLNSYLSEYTQGMAPNGSNPTRRVTQVENERRFVKRLCRAVELQSVRAMQFSERVNQKMQFWQRERAHLEALERAVEQRRRAAERTQSRREQKEADAHAARSVALKNRPVGS